MSRHGFQATRCCILLSAMLGCGASVAADGGSLNPSKTEEPSRLSISGFGTLGYFFTSGADDLRFRRDLAQYTYEVAEHHELADSRLGVQLNYAPTASLEFVGQAVVREKAGATILNSIEWGFAKYRYSANTDIRVGRVGVDIFMLSDFRNVGYAYNWVRPPEEFYGWIPFYSIDGVDVAHSWQVSGGVLRGKLYAGTAPTTLPWDTGFYKLKARLFGLGMTWDSENWSIRAFHTRTRLVDSVPAFLQLSDAAASVQAIWPEAAAYADDLNYQGTRLDYTSLGVRWARDGWEISSEVAYTGTQSMYLPQNTCAYTLLGYRWGAWFPYVGYARAWDRRHLNLPAPPGMLGPAGPVLADNLNNALAATRSNQHTASLGVRWDFMTNAAFKLQWDHTGVSAQGTQLWSAGPVPWNGGAKNLTSVTLDFTF